MVEILFPQAKAHKLNKDLILNPYDVGSLTDRAVEVKPNIGIVVVVAAACYVFQVR